MLETNNDIEFQSINPLDLQDVVDQMQKDILMAGTSYDFQSNSALGLIAELKRELQNIDQMGLLTNLIYRIDIDESKLGTTANYFEDLSKLCWNRVFQKVWLRKKLKTGSK